MSPTKRAIDLLVCGLGLLLVLPLLLLIPLLIKLDDGGPIFFRQERIGRGGRPFRMWKFRSMRAATRPPRNLTVQGDPRITRVGRWLRELKLDELPQLVHVLTGQMTLVGPRPEVAEYVRLYSPEQRRVLELVPGITSPASLRFWDEAEILARTNDPEDTYIHQIMPEKIRIDLEYVKRLTPWSDIRLIGRTVTQMWPKSRPLLRSLMLRYRRPAIVAVHLLLIALGYRAAFELRFDFALDAETKRLYWVTLPVLALARLVPYSRYGVFRGYWRHAGMEDLVALCKAGTVGSIVFVAAIVSLGRFDAMPRSVLVLEWVVTFYLAGGVRFAVRYLRELWSREGGDAGRRTLVVGTGDRAEELLREVHHEPKRKLKIVGLVAERPAGHGRSLRGERILGSLDDIVTLVTRHRIEFIVMALDQPSQELTRRVVTACLHARVEFKVLPSLADLLDGSVRIDHLRNVSIEDLLGRPPVQLDLALVGPTIRDQVVLVTGGAGSIGSELARQIATLRPRTLVLFDQAESALYFTALELSELAPGIQVATIVGDITDHRRVIEVFSRWRPNYVIHAAAYKHVPMMEDNVIEAVRNNVLGTLQVANASAMWGADRFVLISTDKAVRPASIMGATKRIAERLVLGLPSLQRSAVDFRAVRFGNVLGSAGSVVPLFERQVASRRAVTVTHPDVERYFMTIREAAQLVLEAGALHEGRGRITMLEMGQPVRILDLAQRLIRLAGLEPHVDVPIVFTGLRPGEKLREELMSELEETVPTAVQKIRVVRGEERNTAAIAQGLARLARALAVGSPADLLAAIREMVPEGVPPLGLEPSEEPEPLVDLVMSQVDYGPRDPSPIPIVENVR
jgi:FlaA1/EpsC-like NDP-sugar epimerase/lipopolysaccharide/colanic/teichoic acid biosynthesis glycosyltransferase